VALLALVHNTLQSATYLPPSPDENEIMFYHHHSKGIRREFGDSSIIRVDRSAKKQLLKEGASLGWRLDMMLVGGTSQDQVQANSTT
jgi:hypothetical protein